ncbi:hypothetical protein CAPTEDRAFT_168148 [Capitella teleta]|uniref:Androgen-induced gene 1 protein n=1 Tax=Capitella teleta TaxID=283909 RepID=R7VLQ7_CAPTE|nr:hypothetical protein CAPTEDRAFT_168148 [Capitella teleta]|eukprot:ELU18491.1 hypothetical protein CAPTEDRAFT_168148 [Capitella teleta]
MLSVYLVHLIGFIVNGGGLFYDVFFISHNGEACWEYGGFPGKFKHLTFWNQILQTVYFGYSILNDLFGSNLDPSDNQNNRSSLQKFRDAVSASVVFPIGTFVVIAFWALYAVDRELVFPKALDAIIPTWLNHIMHSTVIVFLLFEKFFIYIDHPSRSKGLMGTVLFASIYQAWILWIAFYADIWVYPVLQVLGLAGRAAFIGGCWLTLMPIYLLGERITYAIWGAPSSPKDFKKRV